MTSDIQTLKAESLAKYTKIGRYEIIYTNYFCDFLHQYDDLIAKGYIKPDDLMITALNINLSSCQIMHMIKPQEMQAAELKAIYAAIDAANQ